MNDAFPLILIINLPDRADRRREALAQMSGLGATAEFFPGVRPAELAGFPTLGAHGCFLSHLGALKEARRRGVGQVLIFEDDFQVTDATQLQRVAAQCLQMPWEFLYLGHRLTLNAGDALVATAEPIVTAHAYAVRATQFTPLIDYLSACLTRPPGDPVGGPMHVDGAITMFRAAHPDAVTLVANPSLVTQRSSKSDITTNPLDRIPVLPGLLRRLLRR